MTSISRWISTLVTIALLAFFLSGCSTISVNYDYDTTTNFNQYKTFSWAPDKTATTPQDANQAIQGGGLLSQRIRKSVGNQLEIKGLSHAENNGDILVVIHLGSQDKIQVTNWGYNYSNYYWGGFGGRQMDVYQYTEGRLIIDLVDSKSMELIWRGTGSGAVDNRQQSPDEIQRRIDDVVAQIMVNYPPPLP
ncbi:MAG: DUF4136 domain-containing protein [bacterium]|nr:DUF4136 domain-containing protein [bacterium]